MKNIIVRLALVFFIIVITLMFTAQGDAKIDPKNIVGIWLFDEGKGDIVNDSSGNGNNGELVSRA